MSASVNKVVVIGTLAGDPEVRRFRDGGRVVNLRVTTSESHRDADGEERVRTQWHRIAVFDERFASVAESDLRKGSQVYVEGKIETRSWKTSDGKERSSTEIAIRRFKGELIAL